MCSKDCQNCNKKCPCRDMFKEGKLTKKGWVVVGGTTLALICFHHHKKAKKEKEKTEG